MTRRAGRRAALPVALALVVAAALAGSPAPRPVRARTAPARTCYDCHTKSKTEFAKKKFIHPPVAKADCMVCHGSHGFSQKLVLKKGYPDLCVDCHDDQKGL